METCHFISLFLKMSFFLFFFKFAHDIWQKMRSLLPFSSRFPPRCASCRSDRSGNAQRFITKSGTFQMVHLIVTAAQPHGAFFWSHALLRIKKNGRKRCVERGARAAASEAARYLTARLAKVTGAGGGGVAEGYKWDGGTRWSNRRVKWERWLHSFP